MIWHWSNGLAFSWNIGWLRLNTQNSLKFVCHLVSPFLAITIQPIKNIVVTPCPTIWDGHPNYCDVHPRCVMCLHCEKHPVNFLRSVKTRVSRLLSWVFLCGILQDLLHEFGNCHCIVWLVWLWYAICSRASMIYPFFHSAAGEMNCSFRGASVRHGDGPSFASLFRAGQVTTIRRSIQRFMTYIYLYKLWFGHFWTEDLTFLHIFGVWIRLTCSYTCFYTCFPCGDASGDGGDLANDCECKCLSWEWSPEDFLDVLDDLYLTFHTGTILRIQNHQQHKYHQCNESFYDHPDISRHYDPGTNCLFTTEHIIQKYTNIW